MIEPEIPRNEIARMRTLRDMRILETPLEERYERITRLAQLVLRVPISAFTLVDEARQWFKSIQGLVASETARSISFCAHVINGDDVMEVPDAHADERFRNNPLVTGGPMIGFYAGCPVRAPNGMKIGVICAIDTQPRQMTEDQTQALRDLAAILENELRANHLSHAHGALITELDDAKRTALVDPLTRIWNRGGIYEIMKRESSKASRKQEPLAVVMCDIDHFKKVNDTHGHAVGDEVIRSIARKLLTAIRTEDAVGRVGGEEFLIVLSGCAPDKLREKVERIRHRIVEAPVITDAGMLGVTMSFGVANLDHQFPISIEALIKQADEALYRAKHGGRDRVELAA